MIQHDSPPGAPTGPVTSNGSRLAEPTPARQAGTGLAWPTLLQMIGPVAGFSVLAVLMTWPLAAYLGMSVRDPGDPLLNTWILAWGLHALATHPFSLFDANIFYPFQS